MLLALSWKFPNLTIFHLILLLSIGCPLIHEYNASSFVCASCQQLLATGLSSLKFTNQPTCYTLLHMHMVLPFFVFSLCKHFARSKLFYFPPSIWNSLLLSEVIKHAPIFHITPELWPFQGNPLTVCVLHTCIWLPASTVLMKMSVCMFCIVSLQQACFFTSCVFWTNSKDLSLTLVNPHQLVSLDHSALHQTARSHPFVLCHL